MELTLEQKKARARARARARAGALAPEQADTPPTTPPEIDDSALTDDYGFFDEIKGAATFGLADRVGSAGKAASDYLFDTDDDGYLGDPSKFEWSDLTNFPKYEKHLSERHTARDRYRKENPWMSGLGGVAGGLSNPLANVVGRWMGGSKLAGSGLDKATNLRGRGAQLKDVLHPLQRPLGYKKPIKTPMGTQSLGKTVRRGGASGAGMAGFQGFNEAEGDIADRLGAGAVSAGFGGTLGAGLPVGIKGGAWALEKFANILAKIPGAISVGGRLPYGGHMQTSLGWRKLSEALERDGYTIETATKRLDELGPEAVIADLGENTRALAYSVYSKPGPASGKMRRFAEERHKGTFGDDPASTLEGGQGGRIYGKLDEMYPEQYAGKQKQGEISALYDKAFKENPSIQSDKIDRILRTPSGREVLASAKRRMENKMELMGESDPGLTALYNDVYEESAAGGFGVAGGLKLKTWDSVKRGYDNLIQRMESARGSRSFDPDEFRSLNEQRNILVSELDRLTKGNTYASARAMSRNEFRNEEAFQFGQKFMRQHVRVDDLQATLADMTEEQLHNYRIGAIRVLSNDLSKLKAGADKAQSVLDNKLLQQKIKTVFGDESKFGEYMTLLKNEAEMSKLRKTFGGSQTEKKLAATEDFGVDTGAMVGGLMKIKAQNYLGGTMDILRALKNKVFMREDTAELLGDVLTKKDLSGLGTKYKAREVSQRLQNALSRVITQGASPLVGRQKRREADITLTKSPKGILAK